jgi:HSP20 family protein
MPGLILWKNQEIDRLRRDIDRLFDRLWDDFRVPAPLRIAGRVPSMALSETENALIFKAEIPGVNPEDIDISIREDMLTIQGDVKEDQLDDSEGYQKRKRRYGYFSRTIQLPCRVLMDDVDATYKDGILNIVMPKCKAEAREVKIRVT